MGLVTVQVSQNAGTLSNLMHTTMHANHHACQYVNNLQATWMLIGQFLFPCVYVDWAVLVPLCILGYSSLKKEQEEATRKFAAGQGVYHVGHASLPDITVIWNQNEK